MTADPRVVLIHERFTELGGSEKVVEALASIWPRAELFAPLIDRSVLSSELDRLTTTSSWLQYAYRGDGRYSHLLPFLPSAMSGFDPGRPDVIVISHHAFANRVEPDPDIPVVSYVHTPARWMWDPELRAAEAGRGPGLLALRAFSAMQRKADYRAAQRPDVLVANSTEVAARIRRWWDRSSVVIHPPVAVDRFDDGETAPEREDFFLLAGRLVPYKRPEIAIRAAVEADVPLVVVGDGRSRERCEALAGPNVTFLGSVDDGQLADLYRRCRALVSPGLEDFGIVAVEAQACGAPVLGVAAGGLLDTVVDGRTGVLVPFSADPDQSVHHFAVAMRRWSADHGSAEVIKAHAAQFSEQRFCRAMAGLVDRLLHSSSDSDQHRDRFFPAAG